MPSKKSKRRNTPSPWKVASNSSEDDLSLIAQKLAGEIKPGDRVTLEGPMGVGKTTFARALLSALGVRQPPEGSPTFAIAHEYDTPRGGVVHIDYYRLRSEEEIDDAGIPSYYWERPLIVISEWLSSWPTFAAEVMKSGRTWKISFEFDSSHTNQRRISVNSPDKTRSG